VLSIANTRANNKSARGRSSDSVTHLATGAGALIWNKFWD
jgi:hypothetical protein